jgi:hypothetical protein
MIRNQMMISQTMMRCIRRLEDSVTAPLAVSVTHESRSTTGRPKLEVVRRRDP